MINLYRTTKDFNHFISSQNPEDIGLIATMGNLHAGHLSLIEESLNNNTMTIVTIFVNPKQFGPSEDFASYPRTLDNDLALISSLVRKYSSVKLAVFAPLDTNQIYPKNFSTTINVENHMTNILCGKSRPNHFKGVTTVVYRLFQISKASKAYFGQKDFQQFKIIEKMAIDLDLKIELHMMPIIREESGLALSSRNQYLDTKNKEDSLKLNTAIKEVEALLKKNNIKSALQACSLYTKQGFEYLELLDSKNLNEINDQTTSFVILGALMVGNTRLIDNQLVTINAR